MEEGNTAEGLGDSALQTIVLNIPQKFLDYEKGKRRHCLPNKTNVG